MHAARQLPSWLICDVRQKGKMLLLGSLWFIVASLAIVVTVKFGMHGAWLDALKMLFAFLISILAGTYFLKSRRRSLYDRKSDDESLPEENVERGSGSVFGLGIVFTCLGFLVLLAVLLGSQPDRPERGIQFLFAGAFFTALGLSMLLQARDEERSHAERSRRKYERNPSLKLPP